MSVRKKITKHLLLLGCAAGIGASALASTVYAGEILGSSAKNVVVSGDSTGSGGIVGPAAAVGTGSSTSGTQAAVTTGSGTS